MKINTQSKLPGSYKFVFSVGLVLFFFFNSCVEEPQIWESKSYEQVASDYIASRPEFSEFSKLIEETGLNPLLKVRGPYTILLPDNDAMFEYYKEKKVTSLMDFTPEFKKELALNHIIDNEIRTGDIGLGALSEKNAIGDYVATEFHGADIFLNKYAKIKKRDIIIANGFIHVIDHVLDPLSKNVFDVLSEDPGLSIFTEGLRLTAIHDTLAIIDAAYGQWTERTRFTILAVPDTLYQRMGINSVNDLIDRYAGDGQKDPDDLKNINNGFYRYMEYHCMNGTYYLSDFNTNLYPILSVDNYISISVDTDYKLNYKSSTKKYTGFYVEQSNIPSKNGAIHHLNDLLPVTTPDRMTVTMETTDFHEFKRGDFFGKYYMKWFDGENSFAKIKFGGDFLGYYYKNHDIPTPLLGYDAIFMFGFWWVEITFPKIIKGKYNIIYGSPWTGTSSFNVYVDGQQTNILYKGDQGGNQSVGEVEFSTTAEHRIKISPIVYGALYWDFIQFVPID